MLGKTETDVLRRHGKAERIKTLGPVTCTWCLLATPQRQTPHCLTFCPYNFLLCLLAGFHETLHNTQLCFFLGSLVTSALLLSAGSDGHHCQELHSRGSASFKTPVRTVSNAFPYISHLIHSLINPEHNNTLKHFPPENSCTSSPNYGEHNSKYDQK